MARPSVDYAKYIEVSRLKTGDVIQLTTGEKVTFTRCKEKDFIGTMEDGKSYSIFINKFEKTLESAPKITKDNAKELYNKLQKGDLFYINKNDGRAILFKFDRFERDRIIGISPFGGSCKIDISLFGGKVSDIKW